MSNKTNEPDADTRAMLALLDKETGFYSEDIVERRTTYERVFGEMTAEPASPPAAERNVTIDTNVGAVSAIEIEPPSANGQARSTILFIHGGGWSMGSAACYAPLGRCLAAETGQRVLVMDYPLTPEHTHPAARQAVVGAANWVLSTYGEPLALAGDSAGGHLALLVSRDASLRGQIAALCLMYPVLDLRPGASYESRRCFGGGDRFLTTEGIEASATQYCGNASPDSADLSPVLAEDLADMPPTCFVLPTLDPLYDEGELLREKMQAAGVETKLINVPRTIHGCLNWSARIGVAHQALTDASKWLGEQLAGEQPR